MKTTFAFLSLIAHNSLKIMLSERAGGVVNTSWYNLAGHQSLHSKQIHFSGIFTVAVLFKF
jgi:hypothetical protein